MRKHNGCQVGEESSKGVKRKTRKAGVVLLSNAFWEKGCPPVPCFQSLAVAYTCVVSERSAARRYRYTSADTSSFSARGIKVPQVPRNLYRTRTL